MTYGYCPKCGAKGVSRERRINGNDKCANGHIYKSSQSLKHPALAGAPAQEFAAKLLEDMEQLRIKHWTDDEILTHIKTELEKAASK